MLTNDRKSPPIILRLVNEQISALEALLPITTMGPNALTQEQILSIETADATNDQFILSQLLMYLYINIFVFAETTFVYKSILANGLKDLREQAMTVQDAVLRNLITSFNEMSETPSIESIRLLESCIMRVQPEKTYPTLSNIITVVLATYGRWRPIKGTVNVHRISLQKLEGYDEPVFVLSPWFDTTIDTSGYESVPSLFWKLIYSFNIQDHLIGPNDLFQAFSAIAMFALPLDPTSLTRQMQKNMSNGTKTGIPFINYLAMYLREKAMGLDYNLSPLADARRILMKRVHQFCGVGGTYISDFSYANVFLSYFQGDINEEILSNEDRDFLRMLKKGRPDDAVQFVKSLSYEESSEATKTGAVSPKKPKKKVSDDTSSDTAFSDDSDTLDTSTDVPQSDEENSNDNIDRTSDVGQDSAVVPPKAFLPLALPTETIDDHLLRVMVLRYVSDMDKDPAPDITPENLETLKYWCDSWLFVASIDQTKKLLVQLKLTDQLKELV